REGEKQPAHQDADAIEKQGPPNQRPSNPAGRNASVSSRNPNDTAGAQDGPENVEVRLSTTPSNIAAITVPGKLCRPPSTQIANTRPMYSRPTEGSTGWMMIKNAPAIEAVAMEMANAMRLILIGSAAMSWSAT